MEHLRTKGGGTGTDFQCRAFAALDKDRKRENPSGGVLAVELKELLCGGRKSHDFAFSLLFLSHDVQGYDSALIDRVSVKKMVQ